MSNATFVSMTSLTRNAIQVMMKEHHVSSDVAIALLVVNADEETKGAPFDLRLSEAVRIVNKVRLLEGRDLLAQG